ncbi:MAG: hypothetical protein C0423_14010 [Methylibium sp.]|nr:hypothetical protein [Methylibium sp.]
MTPARNPGQVCACFPGSCRGGEVLNGRTATGHCCRNEVGKAICEPAAIEAAFAADCEAEALAQLQGDAANPATSFNRTDIGA